MSGHRDGFSLYQSEDESRPRATEPRQHLFTEEELLTFDFLQSDQHVHDDRHLTAIASPLTVDDLSQNSPEVTPLRPLPKPLQPASSTPKTAKGQRRARSNRAAAHRHEGSRDKESHRSQQLSSGHEGAPQRSGGQHDDESNSRPVGSHRGEPVERRTVSHFFDHQRQPESHGVAAGQHPQVPSNHKAYEHHEDTQNMPPSIQHDRRDIHPPAKNMQAENDYGRRDLRDSSRRRFPLEAGSQSHANPSSDLHAANRKSDEDEIYRDQVPRDDRQLLYDHGSYSHGESVTRMDHDMESTAQHTGSDFSQSGHIGHLPHPDRANLVSSENITEEENEELRQKLQKMRRSNADLMSANHDLLNQLETVEHQLRQGKHKVGQLTSAVSERNADVAELRAKLMEKEEQVHRTEAALQDREDDAQAWAEERGQLETELTQRADKLLVLQEHLQILTVEVASANKVKDRAEVECARALEAAETMQSSVEGYHRQMQDRIQQYEKLEAEMKTKLSDAEKRATRLEERVGNVAAERNDLQEEIRRFKQENSSEREARMAAEQENLDLRTQVSKLMTRLSGKQEAKSVNADLQQENTDLERRVATLTRQLHDARDESRELSTKLDQALACRDTMDPSDSGVDFDGAPFVVQQLRQNLADREREIAHLRANRDGGDLHSSVNEGLKHSSNERRVDELEQLIHSLEQERGRSAARVLTLEESRTTLELENSSLTAKVQHWTQQGQQLQKELSEVNATMISVERQLRKAQSEAASLRHELEDKQEENVLLATRAASLEREGQEQLLEVKQLQMELQTLSNKIIELESERNEHRRKATQDKHSTELEMVELRHAVEQKELELRRTLADMDRVAQDLNAKQMTIVDLQHELSAARDDGKRSLVAMEQKTAYTSGQVQELQSALNMCKSDLQAYMDQMTETQSQHEQVLQRKDKQISDLQDEVCRVREQLKEKEIQLEESVRDAAEKREKFVQESARMEQMEEGQNILHTQISVLQEALDQERAAWEQEKASLLQDSERLQDTLQAAQNATEQHTELVRDRDHRIETLTSELSVARDEHEDTKTQLEDTLADLQQLEDQTSDLEAQLRDAKTNTRNYKHKLEGVEEDLAQCQEDLEAKRKKLTSLSGQLQTTNQETSQLKLELETAKHEQESSFKELQKVKLSLNEKDKQLTQIKNNYSAQEVAIQCKEQELEQLKLTLQQQQIQLHQRSGQVTQLDVCLKEHQNQMEHRMTSLESALKKSHLEAQQRTNQVGLLDEQVGLLKEQLHEKELQLEQASKVGSRQQVQIHSNTETITTLQQELQSVKSQLLKAKEENLELQKETNVLREEEGRLQQELTQAQCESSLSQRQQERVNSQLQEALQQCQAQKNNASSLSEALELLKVQKTQLESKQDVSKRQMQKALETIKASYQQQVDSMRLQSSCASSGFEQQQRLLQQELEAAKERERHLVLEVETTKAELEQQTKECLRLRDSVMADSADTIAKSSAISEGSVGGSRSKPVATSLGYTAMNQSVLKPQITGHREDIVKITAQRRPSVPQATQGVLGKRQDTTEQSHAQPHQQTDFQVGLPASWQKDLPPEEPAGKASQDEPSLVPGLNNLPSQLMLCTLSDISKADNATGRFQPSEFSNPDSSHGAQYEVHQVIGDDSDSSAGSKKQAPSRRLFGSKAWPSNQSKGGNSSRQKMSSKSTTLAHGTKTGLPKQTGKHVANLRSKPKGPLHSSPRSKKDATKSGRSQDYSGNSSQGEQKPNRKQNNPPQFPKTSDFLSPNISSAMAHYDLDVEKSLQDLGLAIGSEDELTVGDFVMDVQGNKDKLGFDLEARRKALQAMQDELKSHISIVNKHLPS